MRDSRTGDPAHQHAPPRDVELELADAVHGRVFARARAVAQQRAHAREQLGHVERLHDVVAAAEVERGDLLGGRGAARDHDDRNATPEPDLGDQLAAIAIGQTEVEDHEVGIEPRRTARCRRRCRRLDHRVAVRLEPAPQELTDRGLVVDDEHPRPRGTRNPPAASNVVPASGVRPGSTVGADIVTASLTLWKIYGKRRFGH